MSQLLLGIDAGLACSKQPTGVEWFAKSLLQELVMMQSAGGHHCRWHVYLPPFGNPGFRIPPHVVPHLRPDVNTLIKNPWLVARSWLDRLDALYLFGHLLPPGGVRGKVVVTVHDLAFDDYPDCYRPGVPERARAEVRAACARADRIVVPSEATRGGLVERYRYPLDRIDVILEGARTHFTPGEPGPLPERVREAMPEGPFILAVGRLDRRKNIERVIDAYRAVHAEGVPCAGLVIAGPDDSGAQGVRQRLAEGAVPGERIVTTGYVTEDELVALYRSAALLVYPSLAEGFGLPVLEAMACGTPVITSSVSSLPEVAGDAGILVDPTDTSAIATQIRRVLTDAALAQRLRDAGIARAAKLTWRSSAERLAASLQRAVVQ